METTAETVIIQGRLPKNLWNILDDLCNTDAGRKGITFIEGDDEENRVVKELTYNELRNDARLKSFMLKHDSVRRNYLGNGEINRVVVLDLDTHYEKITWFWGVIAAGWIPVISLPYKGNPADHQKSVLHLRSLFHEPLFLTNQNTMPLYASQQGTGIRVSQIEQLQNLTKQPDRVYAYAGGHMEPYDTAMIMLTSGSTGVSKAVNIKHQQILASLEGKAKIFDLSSSDVFLNWTDFSHVANVTEIHLNALRLGCKQIQVQARDIIAEPTELLRLINKYRVSYTFAPNFLLKMLTDTLEKWRTPVAIDENYIDNLEPLDEEAVKNALEVACRPPNPAAVAIDNRNDAPIRWDLGCIRSLVSGGESNVVETCVNLTNLLAKFNAPCSFIRPGFGMTETCAGTIYSLSCPETDIKSAEEFASLGKPTHSIQMRTIRPSGDGVCDANEFGDLQLHGRALFDGYYNDQKATRAAFTKDKWFKTGDVARIDEFGHLHIQGRVKDTLVINGVNHYPHAIEAALEDANIPGMARSFTAIFPFRPVDQKDNPGTECMVIVYLPTYDHYDAKARVETQTAISKTVVQYSGVRPFRILPLSDRFLKKSVLGKLSRSGIRASFEMGEYAEVEVEDSRLIQAYHASVFVPASTTTEKAVLEAFTILFPAEPMGANTNIFDLGVSSSDLLKLRSVLIKSLSLNFPITVLFANPTIRELAKVFEALQTNSAYDPIVVLQPKTEKTTKSPIFFIHPGMGEVLIFMNLARHLDDRPVYALRARGFDGEEFFENMEEIISCYHAAIKKTQPNGPYALAGYSFGSILTWEIAKRMIAAGDEVKFLGTFDQAPFLKQRSRGYDWYECVVSVAFFLGLMEEKLAYASLPHLRTLTQEEVLANIMTNAPPVRLEQLGLDMHKLRRWADLALSMKKMTWEYDPHGVVPKMDIFWTVPLIGIVKAKTSEEWFEGYIKQWDNLVDQPEYHFVQGGHRTMITPPYLVGFQKKFKEVMARRGI